MSVMILYLASTPSNAQSTSPTAVLPDARPATDYSIEGLNLVGSPVTMPLISDTILGVESGFRRALFSEGLLLRANVLPRTSLNLLDGPVPAGQQVYIGQRPTWIPSTRPSETRQIGTTSARLYNLRFSCIGSAIAGEDGS
jgi:hypothetical protein